MKFLSGMRRGAFALKALNLGMESVFPEFQGHHSKATDREPWKALEPPKKAGDTTPSSFQQSMTAGKSLVSDILTELDMDGRPVDSNE